MLGRDELIQVWSVERLMMAAGILGSGDVRKLVPEATERFNIQPHQSPLSPIRVIDPRSDAALHLQLTAQTFGHSEFIVSQLSSPNLKSFSQGNPNSTMADCDSKSKIAIQLGKPSGSSPHEIKKRSRPAYGKRHRAHAMHDESESEDDADNAEQSYGRRQVITSYDIHGENSDDEADKKPRDAVKSKTEVARDKKDKTHEQQDNHASADAEPQDKPIKWGLTINMRAEGATKSRSRTESEDDRGKEETPAKSIDDEAMDALMGTKAPKRRHPDSDAADRDPRPEDYRAVPIDDFGATLLRGFGWDGKMRGKVREVTRHANLTGLGAKDAKGAEDLGAWNQKTAKDSRPVRLEDYQRDERKKRQRMDDRYGDSYKRERERERDRERDHGRHR